MLPDSMNVGVIAENIKKLEVMVQEAGSELPTPEAGDAGKILKVGSDGYELAEEYSYTPPAYSSTTEVNTGVKWVDGKDIYKIYFADDLPESTSANKDFEFAFDTLISMTGVITAVNGAKYDLQKNVQVVGNSANTAVRVFGGGNPNLQTTPFILICEYTKPSPTPDVVPAPDNDTRSVLEPIEEVTEEPVQETKTTRKRSTSSK